jgi:hypothetical protein
MRSLKCVQFNISGVLINERKFAHRENALEDGGRDPDGTTRSKECQR